MGPGLDCDRARVSSEGVVKQVDLTVHLRVYDHRVPHCAVTERHQITGAVLHGCHYPTQVRDDTHVSDERTELTVR